MNIREPFPVLSGAATRYALQNLHENYDEFVNFVSGPDRAEWHHIWNQADIAKASTPELVACVFFGTDRPDIQGRARHEVVRRYEAEFAEHLREQASLIDLELEDV